MAQKKSKSRKTVKALPAKLTTNQAKGVRGGKHIGQPKYGDITFSSGTGMSKNYWDWKK